MLSSAAFRLPNMERAAQGGFTNATDFADYLVRKGLPFRDAHHVSATAVRLCIERGIGLSELELAEYKRLSPLVDADVFESITLAACVERRSSLGGPALSALTEQFEIIRRFVGVNDK
jgi:argininosuccinate lyase